MYGSEQVEGLLKPSGEEFGKIHQVFKYACSFYPKMPLGNFLEEKPACSHAHIHAVQKSQL